MFKYQTTEDGTAVWKENQIRKKILFFLLILDSNGNLIIWLNGVIRWEMITKYFWCVKICMLKIRIKWINYNSHQKVETILSAFNWSTWSAIQNIDCEMLHMSLNLFYTPSSPSMIQGTQWDELKKCCLRDLSWGVYFKSQTSKVHDGSIVTKCLTRLNQNIRESRCKIIVRKY